MRLEWENQIRTKVVPFLKVTGVASICGFAIIGGPDVSATTQGELTGELNAETQPSD